MKFETKAHEEKMQKAIAAYEYNLGSIRAGQANPSVLSRVSFEYYGSPTPISTMADIRVADARTLTITPYDATTLKAIEKAILASDVGITPTNDGKVIRLIFPQLTEERRKELRKQVQKEAFFVIHKQIAKFLRFFCVYQPLDTPNSQLFRPFKEVYLTGFDLAIVARQLCNHGRNKLDGILHGTLLAITFNAVEHCCIERTKAQLCVGHLGSPDDLSQAG